LLLDDYFSVGTTNFSAIRAEATQIS
jgi:hypothetical protein